MENYLTCVRNTNNRVAICKLRLSNRELMFEKGRHLKIDKIQRFCPFCQKYIEPEQHLSICGESENIISFFNLKSEQERESCSLRGIL